MCLDAQSLSQMPKTSEQPNERMKNERENRLSYVNFTHSPEPLIIIINNDHYNSMIIDIFLL